MSLETIISLVIQKLQMNDQILIQKKMEWATAHRLALYLEDYFPGWNIDCEYNKMGDGNDPKHNSAGQHRRPDIVIHKRERSELENNLLVVEIKMDTGDDLDENKLIDFTSPPNQQRPFQYKNGLKITFLPNVELKWFRNGENVN